MRCDDFDSLEYLPETGHFFWLKSSRGRKLGVPAGNVDRSSCGYVRIYVQGKRYQAHRLAWRFFYGQFPPLEMDVDHINGNRSDNRIENLRLASRSENAINSGIYISNTTGFKGVSKAGGGFVATANCAGKSYYLGIFDTPQAAHFEYTRFCQRRFGAFFPKDKL